MQNPIGEQWLNDSKERAIKPIGYIIMRNFREALEKNCPQKRVTVRHLIQPQVGFQLLILEVLDLEIRITINLETGHGNAFVKNLGVMFHTNEFATQYDLERNLDGIWIFIQTQVCRNAK